MGPSPVAGRARRQERLDKLRGGASVTDLYEGDVS